MINMLRAMMDKTDNMQEQMSNWRKGKSKSKKNARNQQHCNRNEKFL